MKTIKKVLTCLFLILLTVVPASANTSRSLDNIKEFYIETINDPEWKSLPREERIEALRLDAATLDTLSTAQLFELILVHPFSIDALLFSEIQEGYASVLSESEILQEIVSREDVDNAVFSVAISKKESKDSEDYFVENSIQDVILFGLFNQNRINQKTLTEIQSINDDSNAHSMFTITIESNDIDDSLQFTPMAVRKYVDTTVTTQKGSKVAALIFTGTDFTQTEKNNLHQSTKASYPNITLITDATLKYNCHSYSFYSTSTSNNRWINYPSHYITDGSFNKTSTVRVNNRMVYEKNHSGIISGVGTTGMGNIRVKSKWGSAGVYSHYYNDSPYGSLIGTYTL